MLLLFTARVRCTGTVGYYIKMERFTMQAESAAGPQCHGKGAITRVRGNQTAYTGADHIKTSRSASQQLALKVPYKKRPLNKQLVT